MKLDDWAGLSAGGRVVPTSLLTTAGGVIANDLRIGESELASAVGWVAGEWTVATATIRGCHVVTARGRDGGWITRTEFTEWMATREVEVWLSGFSPLDLDLRVYIQGRAVAIGAKGEMIRPLLDFVSAWETAQDAGRVGRPVRGASMLEFQGGLLDGHTFGLVTRGPLPDEIAGSAFGDPSGRYVRVRRVRAGGPFAMVWTVEDIERQPPGADAQIHRSGPG